MATLKLGVICCLTMFSMDASLSFVNGSYPFNGLSHALIAFLKINFRKRHVFFCLLFSSLSEDHSIPLNFIIVTEVFVFQLLT